MRSIALLDGSYASYYSHSLAYRAGVTSAITAPSHDRFYSGLGTFFSLGGMHKLQEGAIIQEVTGVHVAVRHFGTPSVSTQIAALRRLLLGPSEGAAGSWFKKAADVCLNIFFCCLPLMFSNIRV